MNIFNRIKTLFIRILFLAIILLLSVSINAQVSRNDTKSSIPYRSNYQRIVTSSSANHCLEIGIQTSDIIPLGGVPLTNGSCEVWGWGDNRSDQLQVLPKPSVTKHIDANYSPKKLFSSEVFVCVATGGKHSLGIKSDGSLWAWGDNEFGQLGLGFVTTKDITTKVSAASQVGNDKDWVSVVAGYAHSVALKSNGTLWGWGLNEDGQVPKNGSTNATTIPIQIGVDNGWTSITAGDYFTMALRPNTFLNGSSLFAWGRNADGQLGTGDFEKKTVPTDVLGVKSTPAKAAVPATGSAAPMAAVAAVSVYDHDWVSISAGSNFASAIKSDGTLWTWGANDQGQLGLGTAVVGDRKNTPTQVENDNNWVEAKAGGKHMLALKSNGTIMVWGSDDFHQTVKRDSVVGCYDTLLNKAKPTKNIKWNTVVRKVVDIEAGQSHSLLLKDEGSIAGWGKNNYGQLARAYMINPKKGDSVMDQKPVFIKRNAAKFIKVSICNTHILALKDDGTIYEVNGLGSLSKVGSDNDWVSVAAGSNHSLALKSDGSLWTWGDNTYGQLGNGSNNSGLQAVTKMKDASGNDYDWKSIGAGNFSSYALRSDGTLWAWGHNEHGQLGNKTANTDMLYPKQMWSATSALDNTPELDDNWVSISGGGNNALAIKADGSAWLCGDNSNGKLGFVENDGTYQDKWWLRKQGDYCLSLSSGIIHSVALKTNGKIWTWGSNLQHQLGHQEYPIKSDEYPVLKDFSNNLNPEDNKWICVAAGLYSTFGIKADGTLWGWGWNGNHQLGVETPILMNTGSLYNADALMAQSISSMQSLAMSAAGGLVTALTALNSLTTLGDVNYGKTIGTETPVQIGTDNDWISVVSGTFETLGIKANGELYRWGNDQFYPSRVIL